MSVRRLRLARFDRLSHNVYFADTNEYSADSNVGRIVRAVIARVCLPNCPRNRKVTRMPVAYIPRTRDLYDEFTPYRWVENDSAPFTPLTKPIAECRVALISSGGIMYRDQPRFHREDASYRRIPIDAGRDDLSVWHFGYPTRDAERDVNCVFPLMRMRELAAAGVIGELIDPAFSFMGGIYSARKVRDELAPQIVDELKRAHADAFFLVPA
jgi:D-proline reductase (dithiol) PrdB